MNATERHIAKKYIEQGYKVFHCGWPDLLAIKDGNIVLVEVKLTSQINDPRGGLTEEQYQMKRILSDYFQYVLLHTEQRQFTKEDRREIEREAEELKKARYTDKQMFKIDRNLERKRNKAERQRRRALNVNYDVTTPVVPNPKRRAAYKAFVEESLKQKEPSPKPNPNEEDF